ncbi:MAG: hypothetical protein LBQ54_08215 [Planctomycetaceae bacterium]|jgi:hypothetical protein|nr:hypothetical protein [Planctomycetaceae bacterium]
MKKFNRKSKVNPVVDQKLSATGKDLFENADKQTFQSEIRIAPTGSSDSFQKKTLSRRNFMRIFCLVLTITFFLFFDIMAFALDTKNEKEMLKEFKTISLNEKDFSIEKVEKINESVRLPTYPTYEFIGKPEISTQEDRICYQQEVFLKNKTKIFLYYMILNSSDDAAKAANYCVSDTTNVASVVGHYRKESMGLTKNDAAYAYNYHHTFFTKGLTFQCENIVVGISIHTDDKKPEEVSKICEYWAKIIIERIKNTVRSKKQTE